EHLVLGALAAGDATRVAFAVAGAGRRVAGGVVVRAAARRSDLARGARDRRALADARDLRALGNARGARHEVGVERPVVLDSVVVERAVAERAIARIRRVERQR